MTEPQRDVAAEAMQSWSSAGGSGAGATPQATVQPSNGAPAPASPPVVAPWGPVADPHEAIRVFEADPQTRAALLDSSSALHSSALRRRGELYATAYGSERGDIPQGTIYGEVADGVAQGPEEVTEEQMQAAYSATATGILERQGLDAETAQGIAETAIAAGLSTLEISDISQAISGSRCPSPEAAIASLGDNAAQIIRAAQQEAHALGLPAELLDLPVGEHLVLGEHPAMIKALARRRGVR